MERVCSLSSSNSPGFETQSQPQSPLGAEPPTLVPESAPEFLPPVGVPAPPPVENPVFGGWDVALVAVVTFVALVVAEVVVAVVALRYVYPHAGFSDLAQKPMLALVSELLAYLAVAVFMVMWVEGKYRIGFWDAIQWKWPSGQFKFLALGGLMLVVLSILERFLPMPKSVPFDKFFEHPRDAYVTSIFAVTLGPLMEELFFRGFLYPVLTRSMGIAWGIFLTAVPFALLHSFQFGFAWAAVLVIFIVGLVLASVRAATKSVASSFLVHVGYNGTLMLIAALQTDGFRHFEKAAGVVLLR
jgi:uncharacterized protein